MLADLRHQGNFVRIEPLLFDGAYRMMILSIVQERVPRKATIKFRRSGVARSNISAP